MSYRTRVTEPSGMLPTKAHGPIPQTTKTSKLPADKTSTTSHRLSLASNSSAGRRSSASLEGGSARPSGIPRPTKTTNSTKPNVPTFSKPTVTSASRARAATNANGIGSRTMPRTTLSNNTPRILNDDDLMPLERHTPAMYLEHDSVLGVAIPQKEFSQPTNLPPRLIPELQALAAVTQRRPTPAMSTISTISSPSTQFTASPSPWSASTTATTPTSWSSASPALIQPTNPQAIAKRSQTVPIPSLPRSKLPKLPALKESAASSASTSKITVSNEEIHTPKKTKKKTPMNSPAPTPPPRKSSIKRTPSDSNSKGELVSIPSVDIVPPVPVEQDISPILKHVEEVQIRRVKHTEIQPWNSHYNKLQQAINFLPHDPEIQNNEATNPTITFETPRRSAERRNQSRQLLDPIAIKAHQRSDPKNSLDRTRSNEQDAPSTRASSRSRLAKLTKLAFFGKSSKNTAMEFDSQSQARKFQRRGPSAGTGHEGYDRPRKRERRPSNDGHTTGNESESSISSARNLLSRSISRRGRSNSKRENRSSQSDLDDFASTRLKPVVIRGGSQTNRGSNTAENIGDLTQGQVTSTEVIRRELEARECLYTDQASHPSVTSSGPLLRDSRLIFHPGDLDSNDDLQTATRRSEKINRDGHNYSHPPTNFTAPIRPPYASSYNSSQSSIAPTLAGLTETSSSLYRVNVQKAEKQQKKNKRLNWGFFRKKELVPETNQPQPSSRKLTPRMPVRVSVVPPVRPMPYYAVLESENEFSNPEDVSNFLTETARTISIEEQEKPASPTSIPIGSTLERNESVLLPAAPRLRRHHETISSGIIPVDTTLPQPSALPSTQPSLTLKPKQPRLAQVGRIPKVVPTTQATVQLPHISSQPIRATANQMPHQRSIAPPTLSVNTNLRSTHLPYTPSSKKGSTMEAPPTLDHVAAPSLIYSHMPDRYSTTSSSSDGVISVMGPPLLPAPTFPRRSLRYTTTEDDVWNEYDDFIDHVISPPRLKKSSTRISDQDKMQSAPAYRHESKLELLSPPQKTTPGLIVDTSLAPPSLLRTSPLSIGQYDMDQDFHLRRSRILSALHSSIDPSSPYSIGDYFTEQAELTRSSMRNSDRYSDYSGGQNSSGSPQTLFVFPEPPSTQPELKHYENTLHMDELERSRNPARHSEHLYASLMVSRWLSFGRVLFSPAHSDLQKQPERHVLVIDGLGSEDWSIYCAVTYEQAYIYDLKETGHSRTQASSNVPGSTPQNFRRRQLASFQETFNFPDNFFSVIVLRFPPVMAESKMRHIVSECRRVLAPGGYMELMLLDLDIVNMGVSTRRAMRELKTRMTMCNKDISLKPVIDNIQSVLGEKGFTKLSKCIVGVPVSGQPPGGSDSPVSSRSSGTSDRFRKLTSAGPRPLDGRKTPQNHNFSLNDLIADHSENADAKIGRMVSRTARSWWQHCFEAAVITDGDLASSIFADKEVLAECKTRASSFKLLIAYAQKPGLSPLSTKRRTMSEPVIATPALATARSS